MVLAPYFAKSAQAASRILHGFDANGFADTLRAFPVGVAWDRSALTFEGRAALDLLVDLLARLYPEIRLTPLDEDARLLLAHLSENAKRINPRLGLAQNLADAQAIVVVGDTPPAAAAGTCRVIYVGSREWEARLAFGQPVGSGESDNAFGAGFAACLGAAAVFRHAFASQLGRHGQETDVRISILDLCPAAFSIHDTTAAPPRPSERVDVGDLHLVGIGAIGHGAVWALRRTSWVTGTVFLIDGDPFDETNPQRYVETAFDVSGHKPSAAASRRWSSPDLVVKPIDKHWASHVTALTAANGHWRIDRIALALDNVPDRVLAQAALPRHIYNAWTRAENLGVSRHDFLNGPCVSCLYMPRGERPSEDELVAGSLGMTQKADIERVRVYLDSRAPLDTSALDWIAERMGCTPEIRERLSQFEGQPITTLYSRGICGGVLLVEGVDTTNAPVEVPMAFQSALAGILLAAEVVIDAGNLRPAPLLPITEINLLRPLGRHLNRAEVAVAECICQDEDFRRAFCDKYYNE